MKNLITGLMSVAFILVSINASSTVQLVPSAASVYVSDSFTVNVEASDLTNVDSASVKLSYDSTILRLDGITLDGGAAFCNLIVKDSATNDGQVEGIFALAHSPGGEPCAALSGDFVAFQIQMTALAAGNASISMNQDANGFGWTSEDSPGAVIDSIETTAQPVQVAVIADADADGVIDSIDNCPATSNTDQKDSGGVDTNSADGIGDACQCGDISGDGKITNTDSVLIKRHLLGLPSKFEADFCDVNGDAQCTNTDAILIQRAIVSLPPGLRQTCTAAGN